MKKLNFFLFILIICIELFTCVSCAKKIEYEYDFSLFSKTPVSKLAEAVQNENVLEIKKIIKFDKPNLNYQEPKFGNTLLISAVINNKYKSAKTLLNCGANPNIHQKGDNEDALLIVCKGYYHNCDIRFVKLLVAFGANIDEPRINRNNNDSSQCVLTTPLMAAVVSNCPNIVEYLLKKGSNINQYVYYDGYGVITESIIMDNLNLTKYLIIDKNAKIPPCCYKAIRENKEKCFTIRDMLNEKDYEKNSENYKNKEIILEYLDNLNNDGHVPNGAF